MLVSVLVFTTSDYPFDIFNFSLGHKFNNGRQWVHGNTDEIQLLLQERQSQTGYISYQKKYCYKSNGIYAKGTISCQYGLHGPISVYTHTHNIMNITFSSTKSQFHVINVREYRRGNVEKLATYGIQDEEKQSKNTMQYVLDTIIHTQTQTQ